MLLDAWGKLDLDLLEVITNLFVCGLIWHCIGIYKVTDTEIVAGHFSEASNNRMDQGKYSVRNLRFLLAVLAVPGLEVRARENISNVHEVGDNNRAVIRL